MIREGERHRCVVPEHMPRDSLAGDQLVEELTLHRRRVRSLGIGRQMWNHDGDGVGALDRHRRAIGGIVERLFHVKDASLAPAAHQQVLRSLAYEVPTQMGQTDEIDTVKLRGRRQHGVPCVQKLCPGDS